MGGRRAKARRCGCFDGLRSLAHLAGLALADSERYLPSLDQLLEALQAELGLPSRRSSCA